MESDDHERGGNRRVRLVHWRGAGNPIVFSVIVVSALLVTSARTLAPFEVGKDQATQLEAAERLAAGKGLTTTSDVPPSTFDIIEALPPPKHLTSWPPGFSLIIAALLSLGLSLAASLKILYVTVTLLGWIGWATLVSHFLSRPWCYRKRNYHLHIVIAALLPVFTTLPWGGTDIFLWAGIPFIFFYLFRKGTKESSYVFVALAGLLLGSLFAIRYASIFMILAVPFILAQVNVPDFKAALKKFLVFFATALLLILPTAIFVKTHSQSASALPVPAYATSIKTTSSLSVVNAHEILFGLPMTANLIFGVPMSDQLIFKLGYTPVIYVLGVVCLLILLALPLILIKSSRRDGKRFQDDMALSLSFLPLALVAFLISVVLLTDTGFMLNVRRYYMPVALCGILIFYQIVTERETARVIKTAAGAIVLGYVIYLCGIMPALAFVPERSAYLVKTVLGFMPANTRYPSTSQELNYPSTRVFSIKESSKQEIKRLYQVNPRAVFFVEDYAQYIYDGFPDERPRPGKELRVFPRGGFWRQAYTSQPVSVFWVVNQDTELDFLPDANQHVLVSDPIEKTRIIGGEFPAGFRFGDKKNVE